MNKDQADPNGVSANLTAQLQAAIPDYDPETTELLGIEEIPHPEINNALTVARQVASQVLYELDTTTHHIGDVINVQLDYHVLSGRSVRHMQALVHGVRDNSIQLDRVLAHYAPEWPLAQIAVVDRNILRMALYEIGIREMAPLRVIINEAVELAKRYGADRSSGFVNGVLGAIASNREEAQQLLELTEPAVPLPELDDDEADADALDVSETDEA